MSIRGVFVSCFILVLFLQACQNTPETLVAGSSTVEPTSKATELATPTALPPTETATMPPEPTLTVEAKHIPVITSVNLRSKTSQGEMTVYQDIKFTDSEGDVHHVDYEVMSSSVENVSVKGGKIILKASTQKTGGLVTGTFNCGDGNYDATLAAILSDRAGNKSEPYQYTIVCNLGAKAVAGFPDLFDDNRNGWDLDNEVTIQDGRLQFRNIPKGKARWKWCKACKVDSDHNTVSVEAAWSTIANRSLGLLVDNDVCTPDGLVFVISHYGNYSILQSVRDASGTWKYWRPFIAWTKSDLIRKAQNMTNVISAVYEFGDELHVTFFINGTRVTRVKVFGYNGFKECRPGVFSDSEIDANFDNFSITPPNP